ncbi:CHAP domain-containing protein [Lysinibacter sp. HNR]|uniref:CHAP domain-containing protein n=1 Tax=Lysinibacter sp. HNR TaxID=3031408 RepID=UPI002435333D|nr:CHAP domain-containing protein [Lysinibacter sp. HNR]WGD37581.1 CHAP domain-containing protein [Lysinibacter sp. HNR]
METTSLGSVLAGVIVLLLSIFLIIVLFFSSSADGAACSTEDTRAIPVSSLPEEAHGYSQEQLTNAAHIMNVAHEMGLGSHGQKIGVMTAIGESSLRVLGYGDQVGPDSRGLFQQRNSWGTLEERMDPRTSARLFFERLQGVDGWQNLEPTEAAHRVQRNANPLHYAKSWDTAVSIVATLSGTTDSCAGTTQEPGDDYPYKGTKESAGLSPLGYYYGNCTDFVAWRINRDAGVTAAPWKWVWKDLTPTGGHGKLWGSAWSFHGWPKGDTPRPGAIAWFDIAGYGHVAYVQAVNEDGTVFIEEYNWPDSSGRVDNSYHTRTIPASQPTGYLYPPNGGW